MQCSPFQAVTAQSTSYCRLKSLEILENLIGERIALPVNKFILAIMLKLKENIRSKPLSVLILRTFLSNSN